MKIYEMTISVVGLLMAGLFDVHANNLFESDWASGNIYQFTPTGVRSTFASGLSSPEGLAFDQAGNLFVGNAGASEIVKITPDGTKIVFASGFLNPYGLAFNTAGDLFVSTDSGTIMRITPGGVTSTFAAGFNQPFGIAFDRTGNLFVADAGHYQIVKVSPDGQKSVFASGIQNYPEGFAFNSAGDLFMSHVGGGITRFTSTGSPSAFASGSSLWLGLAFDASGNLFAADSGNNRIIEFTPDGLMTTFSSAVSQPFGLAFEGVVLPVPEPSVLCLVAAGLAGIVGRCRLFQSKKSA